MKLVPYKIVNKDGKPYIQVKIKDGETKVFSPEEISAMILTKMKETAEAFLGKKIKDAVVTVPGECSIRNNVLCWKKGSFYLILDYAQIISLFDLQLTSMMPRGRPPRMLALLLGSMWQGLSMNQLQLPLPMVWTRRVVRKTYLSLTLVVGHLMSVS